MLGIKWERKLSFDEYVENAADGALLMAWASPSWRPITQRLTVSYWVVRDLLGRHVIDADALYLFHSLREAHAGFNGQFRSVR